MTTLNDGANDPLNFVRNLWGNMGFNLPGMVTPTFDVDELEKRINDLKAVEGWLRMNLSMLQMTIQGLEMQRATLSVVQAMGDAATQAGEAASASVRSAREAAAPPAPPPPPEPEAAPQAAPAEENSGAISQAAMWPWTLMQQMQEAIQHAQQPEEAAKPARKPRATAAKSKAKAKPKTK